MHSQAGIRMRFRWFMVVGTLLLMLVPVPAEAQSRRGRQAQDEGVTQAQYRRTLELLRRTMERTNQLEREVSNLKRQGGGSSAPADGMVDLSELSSTPSGHRSSGVTPKFKFFFDLAAVYRPGLNETLNRRADLTFTNYHTLTLVEMLPDAQLQFGFELSPAPRYYEIAYQLTDRVQVRAGRIWIPFDDLSPHSIFGGRVNTSTLQHPGPGSGNQFLPDLWTDLGVAAKFKLTDTVKLSADAHFYMVNGFGKANSAPSFPEDDGGNLYPSFSSTGNSDNNNDKAIGARIHGRFLGGMLGAGASLYRGRYTDQQDADAAVLMGGVDTQLRIKNSEFRLGVANMSVDVPDADLAAFRKFTRNGVYLEGGQRLGSKQDWRLLGRIGTVQLDSRLIDNISDQTIMGLTLLWRPGMVEYSAHFSRDFNENPLKTNRDYFSLRMVMAF